MLYFSSEVKMGAQKRSVGQRKIREAKKIFTPELGPPHFQFASYAYEFTTSVRL